MPHVHISGINAALTFLFVTAIFGTLHLVSAAYPNATASRAWQSLGF